MMQELSERAVKVHAGIVDASVDIMVGAMSSEWASCGRASTWYSTVGASIPPVCWNE